MVRACVVFSVSLDIPVPSGCLRVRPPATSRGVGPPLAVVLLLFRTLSPLFLPLTRDTRTYIHVRAPSLSFPHPSSPSPRMRMHTRARARPRIISKTKEGEFPSRWGRLEGRRAPVLVGRGCGGRHRATQCRRDARPNDTAFAKGYFSLAAISLGNPLDGLHREPCREQPPPRWTREEKRKIDIYIYMYR